MTELSDEVETATAAGESGTPPETATRDVTVAPDTDAPVDVRGAIYIPARAFNFYQMWRDYDSEIADRDLGYAEQVNLNAIRTWGSYEFWKEEPEAFFEAFEDFVSTADDHGIRVLIGLFEGIGNQPTRQNLEDENLMTATGVASPSNQVLNNRDRWENTREFTRQFMERYADDDRLLAIEVMNEPGWNSRRVTFSKAMYETMWEMRGSVPLTIGATSMAKNAKYADWNLDLFQFHYNFPTSQEEFRDALRQVVTLDDNMDEPVMLTEWQRVRSGAGFHTAPPREQRTPDYASMAPIITEMGVGNFFWSLMVQPAYFSSQREVGILNGLFHEDGAVWSLEDARAIKAMSGEDSVEDLEERERWPQWTEPIKQEVYGESVATETPDETETEAESGTENGTLGNESESESEATESPEP
ncbi:cellulase family glycosylhydrolase [Halogeometricum sp. S1BR25-6]|uniref:Cellulase family glycosylhydrolase n=1 Tax=Halogeometricum salsisoli TaxID=2950536 RepID=A0ABU2GE87_9EURY|nr:cellulase family glycosylhydrolase [Halogeometricum sp. S1BR25-6]MDS0298588.1 cellulase family glycosylhydrolase [Halogeometricum sp. S1BR25-6]